MLCGESTAQGCCSHQTPPTLLGRDGKPQVDGHCMEGRIDHCVHCQMLVTCASEKVVIGSSGTLLTFA